MSGISIPGLEVLEPLAPTAGAEVYLARRAGAQDRVLLRVLRAELTSSPIHVARFLAAVSAARSVSHPHLARVLDSGLTAEGRPWVSTEHFDGEDLAQHLRTNSGLSPAEVIRLSVPMCEALEAAHAVGVLHGGIRPSSIFIARGQGHDASRLLDLGLSFEGDTTVAGDRAAQVAVLMYAAPETIGGGQPDVRSDLYSFGVVMYEALTGAPPFVASGPDELRRLQLEKAPRRLTGPHAPLASIVERCLAKNPIDRFATAKDLAQALRTCRLPTTLDPLTGEPPPPGGEDAARERLGDLLGSYQLVQLIGEGSMGRVYLAQHTKLGRQVALKVLRTSQTKHRELVQRFFQEARTVNQINHEHIVEVFDFIEELTPDGINLVYCVMELLEGTSLSALLRKEQLSIARSVAMTRQVCSALGAAHQVGVIHRDIKPDNIFLTTRAGQVDYVKVLDFGVAKVTVQPGLKVTVSDTASGALVGTPTYMSPEQAAGEQADARADIYALGTLLYEMVAGHPPFQSTTFGQLAAEIITRDPPPIGNLSIAGEKVPPGLKAEILRALEKDPKARHPTMEAFSQALAPFATQKARPQTSRLRLVLGAGVLVVAAIALVIGLPALAPPAALAPPPPIPVAAPVVAPQPPPPPAVPETVKLTVGSTPAGARVVREDTQEELGITPFSTSLPRADLTLLLRLELAGHHSTQRSVGLDSNTALDVSLEREKTPTPTRPKRPVGKAKKRIGKESTIDPFSE